MGRTSSAVSICSRSIHIWARSVASSWSSARAGFQTPGRSSVKRIIAAIGLTGILLPGLAVAAEIFEKVGTFDGQFLKIEVGARASAMGNAFVGVADDATA